MEYISTRNSKKIFSFKDVFLKGLADDGGLFVPKKIPYFKIDELNDLKNFSYIDLATEIIFKFCSDEFKKEEIRELLNKSYKDFRIKDVVEIKKVGSINILELFHGPTLAFKDIAMQAIGNMYEKILKKYNLKINIVVATSGDTGAAAISAIKDRENMKIFVLHPENKISDVQRKFMTTVNSKNVYNISLSSNFDECQSFVKQMFVDKKFSDSINMSGVNSINWARIAIQVVYYFFSYLKLENNNEEINFSVPTGNFGDIYAGYIAKKMGLPINKLIVSTNDNDILKRVITTGHYKPEKVKHTISPSMDIQVASNLERLIFDACSFDSSRTLKLMNDLNTRGELKLEKKYLKKIRENFISESLSEKETKDVINRIYKKNKILIDPHTAVAIGAIDKIPLQGKTIILSTAHPAKFPKVVLDETGLKPELPEKLKSILLKDESFKRINNNLKEVKNYIFEMTQVKN
jgi:threonine synthase